MPQPNVEAVIFGFQNVLVDPSAARIDAQEQVMRERQGAQDSVTWAMGRFSGRIALVTAAGERSEAESFLRQNNFPAFRIIETSRYPYSAAEPTARLVDRAPFVAAYRKLRVDPEKVLVVGGDPPTMAAAKDLDMLALGVPSRRYSAEKLLQAGADSFVRHLSGVKRWSMPSEFSRSVPAGGIQYK